MAELRPKLCARAPNFRAGLRAAFGLAAEFASQSPQTEGGVGHEEHFFTVRKSVHARAQASRVVARQRRFDLGVFVADRLDLFAAEAACRIADSESTLRGTVNEVRRRRQRS